MKPRKITLDDYMESELSEIRSALTTLLRERYLLDKVVNCPLCHLAQMKETAQVNEDNDFVVESVGLRACGYCIWSAMFTEREYVKYKETEDYCVNWLQSHFAENAFMFLSESAKEKRISDIRVWLNKIDEQLNKLKTNKEE